MAKKDVYKILTVNPGSTSTKIGYFLNEELQFDKSITHSREELAQFAEIQDQLDYRASLVEEACKENGIDLNDIDIFLGRGGGMVACPGGVYEINDILIRDCKLGAGGAHHPANLASQICKKFSDQYGGWCCTCNPPDVDELMDIARPTGLKEIWRKSSYHALNQKEIAHRYAASLGKKYEEVNLVIAHIGGGISISAHRKGLVIDTTSLISGNGPMMPTRAGEIDTTKIVDLCFSGKYDKKTIRDRLTKKGGLIDHLGTDDAREVMKRIEDGDKYAEVIFNAMIYQISKQIGAMAVALDGQVDQIILTGGMSRSEYLTDRIKQHSGWIAPITIRAGEFELEALAAAGLRAIRGETEIHTYTGVPIFENFDYLKK